MAQYGHGNHWETVVNDVENSLSQILPNLVNKGMLEDKLISSAIFFGEDDVVERQMFTIRGSNDPVSGLSIIVERKEENSNMFVSGYPFVNDSATIRLKFVEARPWPADYEGVLICETEGEKEVAFFDLKYYKNKGVYKPGQYYDFNIAALAYSAEILKETTFSFTGEDAINFLTQLGEDPEMEEDGTPEPIEFDLSQLVSCISSSEEYADDCSFQSPIRSVERISAFNRDFYKLGITLQTDPDIETFIYAKTDFFEIEPSVGEPLRGTLWLQGILVE